MRPLRFRAVCAVFAVALSVPVFAQAPATLTPQFVQESIESIGAVVRREYFDAEVGMQVETALREGLSEGRFPNLVTAQDVAGALTLELYVLTHDKHLAVSVVQASARGGVAADNRADDVRRSNGGVQQAAILPGNIGYLNLTSFWRPDEAREAIATAMHLLRNADALIIDMRANLGGSPDTVAMVISYLFDSPGMPLFEIVHRSGPPDRYTTLTPAPPDRNEKRAVYILTSARTFSAGEGFAFLVQERHRAEVIGEVTAGAANPGQPYPVNDIFEVVVPNGQVKSAVGGGNWEGSGVKPDVAVAAGEALRVAHVRALTRLVSTTPPGAWRDRLQRELTAAESLLGP